MFKDDSKDFVPWAFNILLKRVNQTTQAHKTVLQCMDVCFYMFLCDYVYNLFLLFNQTFGEPMNCLCQILILL